MTGAKRKETLKLELSDDQKNDIREAFNLFDSKGEGFIDTQRCTTVHLCDSRLVTEDSASNSLFGQIRSNAKRIVMSLGGTMATIVVATIAFLLWSDQGLQMDNLEQTMDHTNLLDSLLENFSIPIGIVLALVALFFYV